MLVVVLIKQTLIAVALVGIASGTLATHSTYEAPVIPAELPQLSAPELTRAERYAIAKQSIQYDPDMRQGLNAKYVEDRFGDVSPKNVFSIDDLANRSLKYTTIDLETGAVSGRLPFAVVESGISAKALRDSIEIWPTAEQFPCYRTKIHLLDGKLPLGNATARGALVYPADAAPQDRVKGYLQLQALLREDVFDQAYETRANVLALRLAADAMGMSVRTGKLMLTDGAELNVLFVRLTYQLYELPIVPDALTAPCELSKSGFRKP